jgi:hypothetical protein
MAMSEPWSGTATPPGLLVLTLLGSAGSQTLGAAVAQSVEPGASGKDISVDTDVGPAVSIILKAGFNS